MTSRWQCNRETIDGRVRTVVHASSVLPIAIGDSGLHPVQLKFIDDPIAGYGCVLQLAAGDFHESKALARHVEWRTDDEQPLQVRATRPEAEPARVSLRDPRERWYELEGRQRLAVSLQGDDYKWHRVLFDLSGLDRTWLDWDQQRHAELYRQRKSQAGDG